MTWSDSAAATQLDVHEPGTMRELEQAQSLLQSATDVCPACGGHIQLSRAERQFVVCSYCQSTLERRSTMWSPVGRSGSDFLGLSVLRVLQEGERRGVRFQLVGREQFADDLTWHTDWNVTMANGAFAQLSESDGGYVWYTRALLRVQLPEFDAWQPDASARLSGVAYRATAARRCRQGAAEGEVGRALVPGDRFGLVELRSHEGGVLRIDYSTSPAEVWVGERVEFPDLQIGIAQAELRTLEQLRHLACPSCGGRVQLKSEAVLAAICSSCGGLMDLSDEDAGIRLASLDGRTFEPLLPLGTVGTLDGIEWQVIGFERREGKTSRKTFTWSEYQLYNHEVGFAFIVVDRSAWRLLRQIVGAPKMRSDDQVAFFQDKKYSVAKRFETVSHYVAGEFSRKVEAGRQTTHAEYRFYSEGKAHLLCGEFFETDEVWLTGTPLSLATLIQAFPVFMEKFADALGTECPLCDQVLKLVSPMSRTLGCGHCGAFLTLLADSGEAELMAQQSRGYSGTPVLRSWVRIGEQEWQVLGYAILRDHERNTSFRFNLFDQQGNCALIRRTRDEWHILTQLRDAVVEMSREFALLDSQGCRTKFLRRPENRLTLTYFEGESPERIGVEQVFDTQLFVSSMGDSLWREKIRGEGVAQWWRGRLLTPEECEAISPKEGFLIQLAYAVGKQIARRLS